MPDYHAIHYHISNFVTLFIKLKDVYNLTPYTGEKRKMLLVQSFKHCLVMSCHVFVHQQAAVCPGKLTPGRECLSVCLWLDGRNGWRGDQLCGNFARDFTARTSYERSSTRSSTRSAQGLDTVVEKVCDEMNRFQIFWFIFQTRAAHQCDLPDFDLRVTVHYLCSRPVHYLNISEYAHEELIAVSLIHIPARGKLLTNVAARDKAALFKESWKVKAKNEKIWYSQIF